MFDAVLNWKRTQFSESPWPSLGFEALDFDRYKLTRASNISF
jgi:hypothetical protein